MPDPLYSRLLDAGFEQTPVVFLLMVDILPIGVRGCPISIAYRVGVLLLTVVVAGGREGVGVGLDFGNSEDGVRHRAVGKGIRQAA
jgi:hypothetical protein